jgi:predicted TIM-barrel fold metal-dependent hydrolase
VFQKFPKVKICLAHFGRENEWDKIIRNMMKDYSGLYTDISYSLYDQEHWGYLKILLITDDIFRTRCMFGSDWYMNAIEGMEKQFSINLRAYLGEDLWKQIAEINPTNFLSLNK